MTTVRRWRSVPRSNPYQLLRHMKVACAEALLNPEPVSIAVTYSLGPRAVTVHFQSGLTVRVSETLERPAIVISSEALKQPHCILTGTDLNSVCHIHIDYLKLGKEL